MLLHALRAITICIFISLQLPAEPVITNFDYKKDMPTLEKLIKKEWKNLFPMPQFDKKLVTKMFQYQQPGDWEHPDKTLLIKTVFDNRNLVGFVTYFMATPTVGRIELLAIDPQFRGKGYGKKLTQAIINEFKQKGAHAVELYVYDYNHEAISFYEHLGFSIQKHGYGHNLLLAKSI